jgi:hypothetical protein
MSHLNYNTRNQRFDVSLRDRLNSGKRSQPNTIGTSQRGSTVKKVTGDDSSITHFRVKAERTGKEEDHEIVDRSIFTAGEKARQTISHERFACIIQWALRANFFLVSLVCVSLFIILAFLFAILIIIVSHFFPRCVTSSIFESDSPYIARLNDALNLSWTTFATVGYGMISASTSARYIDNLEEFRDDGSCVVMSIVLSFESLVGILFVSFAGAIIYGKLTQFQSQAQVKFSSNLVVKYGIKKSDMITCPVLEFRMANLSHSARHGQIINGNISTVATIDIENAMLQNKLQQDKQFRNALQSTRNLMSGSNKTTSKFSSIHRSGISHGNGEESTHESLKKQVSIGSTVIKNFCQHAISKANLASIIRKNNHGPEAVGDLSKSIYIQADLHIDNDNPNLVFADISMDPNSHPYFRTTWGVTHTLDEKSPLVTKSARTRIEENQGFWPNDLNNEKGVEESIDFDQLLVSFRGMSKVSGSDVYLHHCYSKDDMDIGYQFDSILVQKSHGKIGVETDDIDKTIKQYVG